LHGLTVPRGTLSASRLAWRRISSVPLSSELLTQHTNGGEMMMRLLLVWIINAAALFLLQYVFPWVSVGSFKAALIAALVLGLINTLIRPVLVILTLPVTLLTLGLFIFVINGLLFWWVGSFVEGFHVGGFWSGVFGAIVYSLISWLLASLLLSKKKSSAV
jgi:putative membrane protein